MQAFAVFAAILAAASANPQILYNGGLGLGGLGYSAGLPLTYAAAPVAIAPAVTKSQYHAQDEFGQASFGHSEPTQAHAAVRDAAGGVRGSFSYVSPDGRVLTTNYVADHNGYRVASNALPVAPSTLLVGPLPVQDTVEVQQAKAEHFAAVAEAQARSGRKKRGVVTYGASPYLHSTVLGSNLIGANTLTYASPAIHTLAASPAISYSAVQHLSAGPAITYSAAPAIQHLAAAPALTYAAAPSVISTQALRQATLTKVVNTPGHAVSYRVD